MEVKDDSTLEIILDLGFKSLDIDIGFECTLYAKGYQRVIYDPRRDRIICSYDVKKEEKKK